MNALVVNVKDMMLQQIGAKRPRIEHLNDKIFCDGGPKPQTLIEISGENNTGKSLLLWQIMASCVPSPTFGGKYCDVVFLNLSQKFGTQDFVRLIRSYILDNNLNHPPSASELDFAIKKCLDAVTIVNCFSPDDYELAFYSLDDIIMRNENIGLMAIDTLCEFYWLEQKRMRMTSYYERMVDSIKDVSKKHNICCAYTVHSNFVDQGLLKGKIVPPTNCVQIDYKIRLKLMNNGLRTLNDQSIHIDDRGIRL